MKIQGVIESVSPVGAVANLNEVRLVDDDRKFSMFNKTDRNTGKVVWLVSSMKEGDTYEFDYEQKPNKKNPKFPYNNLSNAVPLSGGWAGTTQGQPPAETQEDAVSEMICPKCKAHLMVTGA